MVTTLGPINGEVDLSMWEQHCMKRLGQYIPIRLKDPHVCILAQLSQLGFIDAATSLRTNTEYFL